MSINQRAYFSQNRNKSKIKREEKKNQAKITFMATMIIPKSTFKDLLNK